MNFIFPHKSSMENYKKIRTDKDIATTFFLKNQNLYLLSRFVLQVLKNMKNHFFPPLGTMCTRLPCFVNNKHFS